MGSWRIGLRPSTRRPTPHAAGERLSRRQEGLLWVVQQVPPAGFKHHIGAFEWGALPTLIEYLLVYRGLDRLISGFHKGTMKVHGYSCKRRWGRLAGPHVTTPETSPTMQGVDSLAKDFDAGCAVGVQVS